MKPTHSQLKSRSRLRVIAKRYGAPEPTRSDRIATEKARDNVLRQLSKIG